MLSPDNSEEGIFFGKPESNISGGIIYNNGENPNGLQFRTNGNQIRMVVNSGGGVTVRDPGDAKAFYSVKSGINDGIYMELTNPNNYYTAISAKSVAGAALQGSSENNYGMKAYSVYNNALFAYTYSSNHYAGYFAGNVFSEGSYQGSDQKLKQNIHDFTSAMNIINQLKPKQYQFRQDGNYKLMNLPEGIHYGLIAQDVEKVLPNLVKDSKFETRMAQLPVNDEDTKSETIEFKALNYTELIPVIIKGMQEQQTTIQEQQAVIEKQQQEINELKQLQNQVDELRQLVTKFSSSSSAQSSLPNTSSAHLKQNAPNPFSRNTIIQCYVPSGTQAQLIIYNAVGKQLKSFAINNSGMNEVTINAGTLLSGQYIYSLLIDGKKVDSKHMIIIK
jgi:hypothetical protein